MDTNYRQLRHFNPNPEKECEENGQKAHNNGKSCAKIIIPFF